MILPSQLLRADLDPETPVFRRYGNLVTLGEFRDSVSRLVRALLDSGASRAVLYSEDNYDFAVGVFACMHAGLHTVLPGNWCDNTRKLLTGEDTVFVCELTPSQMVDAALPVVERETTVEFFTSGSTGEPKRIVRTYACLEAELELLKEAFPENEPVSDVFSTVCFHHAYGIIFGLLLPMSRRWITDVTPFGGVEHWHARILNYTTPGRIASLVTTPAFLRIWAENVDLCPLSQKIRVLSAGAPLPVESAQIVASAYNAKIFEIYGSSETGVMAYRCPLEQEVWKPFEGVTFKLLPGQGMQVTSSAVGKGAVAELGDFAEMQPDGRFLLQPRLDRIVKLADKRISLPEVEQCLERSDLVQQACALVLPVKGVSRLAIAAVPSAKGELVLREQGFAGYKKLLREILAKQVEPAMLPRRWRFVGNFPCNSQGKIDIKAVQSLFASRLQLPIMFPMSISPDFLKFRVLYVRDAVFFNGHFPGYPIVPGVIILQTLCAAIEKYWNLRVCGIKRLKFSAEARPGDYQEIEIALKHKIAMVDIVLADTQQKSGQGRLSLA